MSTEVLIKAVLKFLKKYLQHMILFPFNKGCISPTLSFSSLGCHIKEFLETFVGAIYRNVSRQLPLFALMRV